MSRGLTQAQKAKILLNEVKTRILLTIVINNQEHDVIKVLENDSIASLTIQGQPYLAAQVKRGNIENKIEGGRQKVSITISNINQAFSNIVAGQGDVLTNSICSIDEVIYTPPLNESLLLETGLGSLLLEDGGQLLLENDGVIDNPVNIFQGFINNVQLTGRDFNFDVERILGGYSTESPNTTYDVNCQWVFKDTRCQYAGIETVCDKTFSNCQTRGNETRFGGYPSIPQELVVK